ncbi:hypothetical protein ACFVVM_06235 [Nocardia sp. NPDC058176]|uniref:hypothetical protein n=1 Tax=Nocardia sp. NPDC058176 TaxID=3346368 RepID=UPI0036DCFD2B
MRSPKELKQQWLTELVWLFARPEMYACSGREMQSVVDRRLQDLCFLDDRDDDHTRIREAVSSFGKLGVDGPFAAIFGEEHRYTAEVASVYAEFYHQLGYLPVDRLLSPAEWSPLLRLPEWVADRDFRRSEVEATFGPPSLRVGKRLLCYAPADAGRWVFFDCWGDLPRRYEPGQGCFTGGFDTDPLVRDIRIPAASFEDGLILTLYGKVLRWGPGWWIHHPSPTATAEQRAIAAQLRRVESTDPSQALKSRTRDSCDPQ